jgi:hypothetical protein
MWTGVSEERITCIQRYSNFKIKSNLSYEVTRLNMLQLWVGLLISVKHGTNVSEFTFSNMWLFQLSYCNPCALQFEKTELTILFRLLNVHIYEIETSLESGLVLLGTINYVHKKYTYGWSKIPKFSCGSSPVRRYNKGYFETHHRDIIIVLNKKLFWIEGDTLLVRYF